MYLTINETAKLLRMPAQQVSKYVLEGRIRSVYDGEQFLINEDQFVHFEEQLETAKQQLAEFQQSLEEPDRDIKDED